MNEKQIRFWNGNKSPTRRAYEQQLLSLCLSEGGLMDADVLVNENNYPDAEDEGNIFANACDVLVSVAGNQKFLGKRTTIIDIPVCRGILGHRLLIIQKEHAERFSGISSIEQLQEMTIGIPETWADADLFRMNGFKVSEQGHLEDIFTRLLARKFDYIALGANEVEAIFDNLAGLNKKLTIEPNLLIYYPLPLVFYVHPDKYALARVIKNGLQVAMENGKHQCLFDAHHPNISQRLGLDERQTFQLKNPYLPASFASFHPKL